MESSIDKIILSKFDTLILKIKKPLTKLSGIFLGAGDETQTRGLFLGKEALYQLSYTRMNC